MLSPVGTVRGSIHGGLLTTAVSLRRGRPIHGSAGATMQILHDEPFHPPHELYAARKLRLVKTAFADAGNPLPEAARRNLLARAWGWEDWNAVGERGDGPASPYDEELAGPGSPWIWSAAPGATALAERRGRVVNAVLDVTGLPDNVAQSFADLVLLTNDPDLEHVARVGRSCWPADPETTRGVAWITPAAFRAMVVLAAEPVPPELRAMANWAAARATLPPLPPNRPRARRR